MAFVSLDTNTAQNGSDYLPSYPPEFRYCQLQEKGNIPEIFVS